MKRAGCGVWAAERELGLVNRYMSTPAITIVAAAYSSRERGGATAGAVATQTALASQAEVGISSTYPPTPACDRARAWSTILPFPPHVRCSCTVSHGRHTLQYGGRITGWRITGRERGGANLATQSRVKQSHAPTQMVGSKNNKLRSTARVLFTNHTGKRSRIHAPERVLW